MSILITGVQGFVGQSVQRAFSNADQETTAFQGYINNPYNLRPQLEEVRTIVHLASAEATGRRRRLRTVDVDGTERLIEEARRSGVNHIVYVSRLGADPNSMFATLRTKGEVERLLRGSGIPFTIIRSTLLFGRRDRFLNTIARLAYWNWPFVWLPGGGGALLQPLWVEDLARMIVMVSDPFDLKGYRNKILTVGGQEQFHYADIVRLVLAASTLRRRPLPARMMLVRSVTKLLFGWQRRPVVTNFFLDHIATPQVTALDGVSRLFGFQPARMGDQIAYLYRKGRPQKSFA